MTSRDGLLEQFRELAEAESATVQCIADLAAVPGAVRDYLHKHQLPGRLIVANNFPAVDWTGLDVGAGPVAADGDTVCTGCYAGIAEAGALVMLSSPDHPTELNFLAKTHIALLPAAAIVASFEQLWANLASDGTLLAMPRMMNFIVGPSRTADLGVPSKLGAHGPARLHILIPEHEEI